LSFKIFALCACVCHLARVVQWRVCRVVSCACVRACACVLRVCRA
jgi:hypothetical protein